jgi:hypothetical protein
MKPTLNEILEATLSELNISLEEYKRIRKSRIAKAVMVRQIVSYIGVRYGYTQHGIADFLKTNHSSVHYHKELAKDFYTNEKGFADKIDKVLSNFEDVSVSQWVKGWVARDKDGSISFFSLKPREEQGKWSIERGITSELPITHFTQVTFEDSPRCCEMTLRLR